MCERHFDLAVITSFLIGHGQAVTVATVEATLKRALANGGVLSIEPGDVAGLMAGPFAESYKMSEPTM